MATENREVLAGDRNAMERFKSDWRSDDFRVEYFDQLDHWHATGHVGPMPEWMLWPLAMKFRVKQTAPPKEKKTPQLVK